MPGPIDLHTHSSVSDGTDSPAELVHEAIANGLGTIAITDHDSTAGWASALAAASGSGLTVIPGMELSTLSGWRSVHVLAYLFDPGNAELVAETLKIRDARRTRAESIVARIAVDYELTWTDVIAQTSAGTTVGRPHIADALVARGHVTDRSAAFESILHPRSGYFEPHYAPDPLEGVRLITAAGGVAVLAHPGTRGAEDVIPEARLAKLVDAGLFGLEIDHRENTAAGKTRLRELVVKFGLEVTGSSDYHGDGKPNRLAENSTDVRVRDRLIERATGSVPLFG